MRRSHEASASVACLLTGMNPLTNIRSRQKQREQEVLNGVPESASYHSDYRSSAYVYAGQLSFNLTEGDLLAIFSQFGEIVDVNLVRDKNTQKSRGFAFLAYEDQRSTDLAVDNLNGITVDGRTVAVDHVKDYKRLVDNPDYVDTKAQQNADTTSQVVRRSAHAGQGQHPSQRILSGAEAEAIEDELGTSGVADPGAGADGRSAPTLAKAAGIGGTSFAEMLREVEAKVGGDWRSRGKDGGEQAAKARSADQAQPAPNAEPLCTDKHQRQEGKSKRKHRHKEKKHKQRNSKLSYRDLSHSRSRSPRPSPMQQEPRQRDREHDVRRHAPPGERASRHERQRHDDQRDDRRVASGNPSL
eukprot:jgi/Ulvmu1/12149/UM085_0013.1